jgi:hypothetical protein
VCGKTARTVRCGGGRKPAPVGLSQPRGVGASRRPYPTLSGAVVGALAACLALALALGAPAWLKIAAAAITAVSAVCIVVFHVAETRATRRKTAHHHEGLGELHGVPPLPSEFIKREELEALRQVLVHGGDDAVGITGPLGLQGKGGIGKTILAAALASDEAVRSCFRGGVFWVMVGERPDLIALQIGLLKQLGTDSPDFRSIDEGAERLRAALAERRCLIVVDDVWSADAARAFRVAGRNGRVLYTTREVAVLDAVGADVTRIDVLSERAALLLLAGIAGVRVDALPATVERVLAATGRVALALALVAAVVGRGGGSWEMVAEELERDTFADDPQAANVFKAMQVAVAALDDKLQRSYRTLAVYPRTRACRSRPSCASGQAWATPNTNGAHAPSSSSWQHASCSCSTATRSRFTTCSTPFLLLRAGDTHLLHDDLLAAYGLRPGGSSVWARLPQQESYIWEHLVYHLRGAGRVDDLVALVCDLAYLAWRSFRSGPYGDLAKIPIEIRSELVSVNADSGAFGSRYRSIARRRTAGGRWAIAAATNVPHSFGSRLSRRSGSAVAWRVDPFRPGSQIPLRGRSS